MFPRKLFSSGCAALLLLAPCVVSAQASTLSPELQGKVADAVKAALRESATPSAEIGIVRHGQVVYTAAFGDARLAADGKPAVPATTAMAYGIGSNSKQFTAVAALVLVERGKLRLDDPFSTWFPELGHAEEITLRNLLNQVSGYEDFYTEDYLTPELATPTDPYALAKRWTSLPLDFAPGTKWEYSNTNYLLAALIVQKVAGEPFFQFLTDNVLRPAGLTGVLNLEAPGRPALPVGYGQFGFAPPREVQPEAPGTLLGAAQLAMPIAELARWDDVVLHRRLILTPADWGVLQTEVALPDGSGTGYGMGLFLEAHDSRRVVEHSGEVSGFTSLNELFPETGDAIAVLTNSSSGSGGIARAVEAALFAPTAQPPVTQAAAADELVRKVLAGIAAGNLDRSLLAPPLQFDWTPAVLGDLRTSLKEFGSVVSLDLGSRFERGGMNGYVYTATGSSGESAHLLVYITEEGKLDQLLLTKSK